MVTLTDITFSYSFEQKLFQGIYIDIKQKKITSIIGNSGCGKSTLLNLIAGLLEPNSGEIIVNEMNLTYLTQNITLLPYRTSFENCLLGLELRDKLSNKKIEEAKKYLSDFGLDNSTLNKFPNELSGGMKQRIGLIQTLLIDTSLYLLDEPFTAIDRNTNQEIQNQIWHKYRTNESSALIVTHDLEQAVMMSDKVIVMPSSNSKTMQEISFDNDFIALSPKERRKTADYEKNIIKLVTSLSES